MFLDFTACFDTVNRAMLMKKLERYGVRGVAYDLLKSYFENRKQYVSYQGHNSSISAQNISVIQGSKNGPLMYDIYSNDLNYICENKNIMFADDTCLVYVGGNLADLVGLVNAELSKVHSWCKFNQLSLNPLKSEFILVTHRNITETPKIYIGDELVTCRENVKYLGLHFDNRLKFQAHIDHLKLKLIQFTGITYRLQRCLNITAARNLYYGCIYSIIKYCIVVWGGILQCTERGKPLISKHNKIVKNLFGKFVALGECIFKNMKILKFCDIHKFYVALHMFKLKSGASNQSVSQSHTFNYPSHLYETRSRNLLIPPFPRVDAIRINFEYQFCRVWNEIPDNIKEAKSASLFKKLLTAHMISLY